MSARRHYVRVIRMWDGNLALQQVTEWQGESVRVIEVTNEWRQQGGRLFSSMDLIHNGLKVAS